MIFLVFAAHAPDEGVCLRAAAAVDAPRRADDRLFVAHDDVARLLPFPHEVHHERVLRHVEIEVDLHAAVVGMAGHRVPHRAGFQLCHAHHQLAGLHLPRQNVLANRAVIRRFQAAQFLPHAVLRADVHRRKDAMRFHISDDKLDLPIAKLDGLLREPYFVPQTKNIDELFKEMQSQKLQMVIVVDEYGQTDGLIAMEDILEEIVGNIMDEYDEDQEYIKNHGKGEYVMEGKTPLKEVEELLDITFDEEEFETLNGFLISRLDRIPEPDEQFDVDYKGYNFKILSVVKKMIGSVLVKKLPEEKTLENAEDGQSVLEEKQK